MIRWIFNRLARRHPYTTEWVDDLPDNPDKDRVYIIGGRKHPFWAAVTCPRKQCGEIIHLDIAPESSDRWCVTEQSNSRITLSPSIHVTKLPCKCHYWLRDGYIVWSETPPLRVPKENRHDR